MKKAYTFLLLVATIAACFVLNAGAVNEEALQEESQEKILLSDPNFILEATVEQIQREDGICEFVITRISEEPATTRGFETTTTQDVVKIVAFTEEEASLVQENIQSARSGGTLDKEKWEYGSSLYLESHLQFTSGSVDLWDTYKMDKLEVRSLVNSGTTITQRQVGFHVKGQSVDTQRVFMDDVYRTISLGINPSTAYAPTAWPFVSKPAIGGVLGAEFICTVSRAGGASATFSLPNNVYQ